MRPRVVLGFSGGVDSAAAARLLAMNGITVENIATQAKSLL